MKVRKYQASQLDPLSVVVPIKDHERRIDSIKGEVAIMLSSMQDAGKITRELKEYLTNKVTSYDRVFLYFHISDNNSGYDLTYPLINDKHRKGKD